MKKVEVYSTNQIMDMLGVSRMSVYRWIKGGELKAFKLHKEWRVSAEELERFLEGRGYQFEEEHDND